MTIATNDGAARAVAQQAVREAQALAKAGRLTEAETKWIEVLAAAPTHANVLAAARFWEAREADTEPGQLPIRIALTGTGTLEPLGAYLRVACAQIGLGPSLYVSGFGQWGADLLAPGSALYEFEPELMVVCLDAGALFPKLATGAEMTQAAASAERNAGLQQVRELLQAMQRHAPTATPLLHTFAAPDRSPLGILDAKTEQGQRQQYGLLNEALGAMARDEFPRLQLLDQERVEGRHGKSRVRDARMWYLASMPFSESFLPVLAAEYVRFVRPLKGLTRKCIVLDLDNTLWGGVVGEDGYNGIHVGGTVAPGNAFRDFQMALKSLQIRGILLALCSKNNPDDVWPVLDNHPGMALRRGDFASCQIGWGDKASGIAAISRELNIGLDSLVFLDDSPAERGLVRQQLPQVLTVEMPRDPAYYVQTLLDLDVFEALSLTQEDRDRGRQYQEQQARQQLATEAGGDLSAYLRGLQIVVTISGATPFTIPRIAQLINKTNQFNVTTRRYTEAQVQAMADDPDAWGVWSVHVADRFGDSGLTGVCLVKKAGAVWTVDSFLLSCRVLARGVEDALMAHVVREARDAGADELRGEFIPTAKNAPASDFFAKQCFESVQTDAEGVTWWSLDLASPDAVRDNPDWLEVVSDVCIDGGQKL